MRSPAQNIYMCTHSVLKNLNSPLNQFPSKLFQYKNAYYCFSVCSQPKIFFALSVVQKALFPSHPSRISALG
jgi:hypothetical protein